MLLIAASLIGLASLAVLISHRIGGPAARRIPAAPAFAAAFGFELFHGRVLALGFLA